MNFKLGTIGYCPPPHFPGADAFLNNLQKYPPHNELLLYSDHPYPQCQVKLLGSPELIRGARTNKWAINNAIFITGMKIARKHGFSHVIYLESDCRVGRMNWDQIIFNEFFNLGFPYIAAGTLVCWNPFNAGSEVARRWEALLQSKNRARNFPIPTYGTRDTGDPRIFPNGALGVYDMAWIEILFDIYNTVDFAAGGAWDFQLGARIWHKFGADSFNMVGQLSSIYSGYGDSDDPKTRGVTTLAERLEMLKSGEICCVHQVKGDIYV